MANLFSPFSLAGLRLPNRIFMAPLTRARAPADAPTEQMALYYAQRATAGLIVSEGTPISREGQGYLDNPGIFRPDQVAGWKLVTDSVRSLGGHIFAQLWHVGRLSHSSLQEAGASPVSSTDRAAEGTFAFARDATGAPGFVPTSKPRALTTDEIPRVAADFAAAARNAMRAGFDAVELHAANGYLFDQFLNPAINDRSDRYAGATLQGRLRFALEVVDAVASEIGAERIGLRLTPYGAIGATPAFEDTETTYLALARALDQRGVAFAHLMDQTGFFNTPVGLAPTSDLIQQLLAKWRDVAPNMTLLLDGGMTKERANALLERGTIDLAGFGQAFIANPDLVARLRHDLPLAAPDRSTYYTGGARGYVDYPPYRQ